MHFFLLLCHKHQLHLKHSFGFIFDLFPMYQDGKRERLMNLATWPTEGRKGRSHRKDPAAKGRAISFKLLTLNFY